MREATAFVPSHSPSPLLFIGYTAPRLDDNYPIKSAGVPVPVGPPVCHIRITHTHHTHAALRPKRLVF